MLDCTATLFQLFVGATLHERQTQSARDRYQLAQDEA